MKWAGGLGAQGPWKILGDTLSHAANETVEGRASSVGECRSSGEGVNTESPSNLTIGRHWQPRGAEHPHFPLRGSRCGGVSLASFQLAREDLLEPGQRREEVRVSPGVWAPPSHLDLLDEKSSVLLLTHLSRLNSSSIQGFLHEAFPAFILTLPL